LKKIAADWLAQPGASIPKAAGDWAGAKAVCRFFDNDASEPAAVLAAHRQAVIERARGTRSGAAPASEWLADAEWKALWCHKHRSATAPAEPPSTHQVVRWIAALGGCLGRKHDGEPGMIVLWRGLQRVHDIAAAWQPFNEARKVVGIA